MPWKVFLDECVGIIILFSTSMDDQKGFKVPDLKLDKDASLRAVRVAEPHLCVAFSVNLDLVYIEHLVLLLSIDVSPYLTHR